MDKADNFEAVTKLLTQLFYLHHDHPMGGNHFILAGNFHQIAPFISYGNKVLIGNHSYNNLLFFHVITV